MATHSSIPARIIQWRKEPSGQRSTGLKRGGHNWTTEHTAHRTYKGFPGGSVVKNPLPMQEPQAWSLVQEDPLEKEMATRSNILAWEIPRIEEPGGLQSMGSQKSWTWLGNQTTTPRVSANVNYELWVITMGQCRFINCNVCTAPEGDVDHEGSGASVGERVTQEISLIFLSICLLWKNKKKIFECPPSIYFLLILSWFYFSYIYIFLPNLAIRKISHVVIKSNVKKHG